MRLGLTGSCIVLMLLMLWAAPVQADGWIEGRSTTTFQLRRDLDGVQRAPLYEDLYGAFRLNVGPKDSLNGMLLMKVGTLIGRPGADFDLYLANVAWSRNSLGLQVVAGRQMLQTAAGPRIADGASLRWVGSRSWRVHAAVGWLRDTEWDDFKGGALLVQGVAAYFPQPSTRLEFGLGFRVGPTTSPRLDGLLSADSILPLKAAPTPFVDLSMRLDTGRLRRMRGGLRLTPSALVRLEFSGQMVQAVDSDGVMAEEILVNLSDGPQSSAEAKIRLRLAPGLYAAAGYLFTQYQVSQSFNSMGHGADVGLSWVGSYSALALNYKFRYGYGGLLHGVGLSAALSPVEPLTFRLMAQVTPYVKPKQSWKTAQWLRAELVMTPLPFLDIMVGGEYLSGVRTTDDLRLNASLSLHGRRSIP